jgi:hypothetical protein
VFHNFPSQLKFDPKSWDSYVEANRVFCRAVVERYEPGNLVWAHDYHLMLLPQMLRTALPDASIGFFLHIPFPSSEIFPILPRREELLEGLLGADLVMSKNLIKDSLWAEECDLFPEAMVGSCLEVLQGQRLTTQICSPQPMQEPQY